MCSHAKVLWSWGAGNWDSTIHLAGHFSFSNAFSTSFREDSWQEEEFKMFAHAAIPIKAWLLDAAAFVETIFRNEKKEEEKWRKSGKDFFYILSFYNYYLQQIGFYFTQLASRNANITGTSFICLRDFLKWCSFLINVPTKRKYRLSTLKR